MSEKTDNRLEVIAGIIERCRFLTGNAKLPDTDLAQAARAWSDALTGIPTDRLDALYREAVAERDVRGPFLPQEIVTIWRAQRKVQSSAPMQPSREACGLCDGVGWQSVAIRCATRQETTAVSFPCGCHQSASPRSPKRPPDWERRSDGVWYPLRPELEIACNCAFCTAKIRAAQGGR